jgi:hypothetical protein
MKPAGKSKQKKDFYGEAKGSGLTGQGKRFILEPSPVCFLGELEPQGVL